MEKLLKYLFSTIPGATVVGSILISLSILISGGVIKINSLNLPTPTTTAAQTQTNPQSSSQPNPGGKVNIDMGHLPIRGEKQTKVTVIEFADFRCPFCERFFKDTESSIIKDYVNTGKVKYAFRHFAFLGQQSVWAAQASECANEQSKFWQFHDWLYNNQAPESNLEYYSKDNLIKYAANIGINTNQFASCLNSDKYVKQVQDDLTAGQQAGVSGTPTIFVNGIPIVGAQPYTAFKIVIDQELK